jgi:hypothetical protein
LQGVGLVEPHWIDPNASWHELQMSWLGASILAQQQRLSSCSVIEALLSSPSRSMSASSTLPMKLKVANWQSASQVR